MSASKLARGIYAPLVTFFSDDEDQSVDLSALETHVLWLAHAGVVGILVQGSTAEAVTLSVEERNQITRTTRTVLDANGFQHIPLIVGAGAQSTTEAIALAKDAAASGGNYVIVLPPAFFAFALKPADIIEYYTEIANKSPLPLLIYSFPLASGGLELHSPILTALASHPNILGVKQTDHNIGKMSRIPEKKEIPNGFIVLGGATDYLIASLAVGASGSITTLANITPRVLVRLFELWEKGEYEEARELQGMVSSGEFEMFASGFPGGIKASMELFLGRGGVSRRPVPKTPETNLTRVQTFLGPVYELEKKLEAESRQVSK